MRREWSGSVDLHLDVDPSRGRRAGLERALREAVRSRRLAPGDAVPSTRALAAELGLARGTVSAAYDQLAAEGYLTAVPGGRTRVAAAPAPEPAPAEPAAAEAPAHDLLPGRPDLSTFPSTAWLRSTRRVLASAPPDVHALGDPRGRRELREALAGYLGRARGVHADPARIVVTSGYAQSLGLLAAVLRDLGTESIAMEEPGHPFHRAIVRRAGLAVVPLPVDERGARPDRLGRAGAAVLTPAHQYPTGATLRPDRRRAFAAWARDTGATIVEDDYDGEFRYDRQPVGALQGTAPDHVVYGGTTSKTLAPALRLAWLVLPAHLVEPFAEAKRLADAHTPSLAQLVLADLIGTHAFDRHVRAARLRYRRRRDLLVETLRDRAPRVRVLGVAAGLHALALLPDGGQGEGEAMRRAAFHDLALMPLHDHWQDPGERPQGLVVGYSTPVGAAYPAALDALCAVLAQA
ncbi:PLP-dependent aminotransferase family protein [Actinomadura luteofluorescens]|uniref:GntR family transcriptional regulator/MocR family aminotransferase n=1 Tax=Actinomadura luteofluorescens TaxID=46163 RepID=A0A7Y9EBA4_9ACTN|nr:PLP-dependent aminotransferase family protein [Actinomadura luteofluorescens]NYD44225.1 GntR family transcriptional regulator/MocR family aminotransferase [Actinomadura luteofluorescens]